MDGGKVVRWEVVELRILWLIFKVVVDVFFFENLVFVCVLKIRGLFVFMLKNIVCFILFFVEILGGWLLVSLLMLVVIICMVLVFWISKMVVGFLFCWCWSWFFLWLCDIVGIFLILEFKILWLFFLKLMIFLNVGGRMWLFDWSCDFGDFGGIVIDVIIVVWLNIVYVIRVGWGR